MNSAKIERLEKLDYMSKAVVNLSIFAKKLKKEDIYSGNENIPFSRRHPIYKALLRLEFEEDIKNYLNSLK